MKLLKYLISILFVGISVFLILWTLSISHLLELNFNFIEDNSVISSFLEKKDYNNFLFYSFLSSIVAILFVISIGLIWSNVKKTKVKGFKFVFILTIVLLITTLILSSIFLWVPSISLF